MIKYFIILNNCNASQYGVGTYVKQLLSGLKRKDYDLSIINMSSRAKEFSNIKNKNGITVFEIPSVETDIVTYARLAFYLLIQNIPVSDKMVFHLNFPHHEPLVHLLKGYYTGCRTVFTVHYLNWCFGLQGNYTKFKRIIHSKNKTNKNNNEIYNSYLRECKILHSVDEIIVLSERTRGIIINDYKIPEVKVHYVRNGLSGNASSAKLRVQQTNDEQKILFVGRLDEQKGIKLIINAYKNILESFPKSKLYIVGDGNYNQFLPLCEGCREKIIFTGKLSRNYVRELYKKATLGILPSYHEQCSYTLIEMMKNGVPAIISNRMDELRHIPECVISLPDNFNEELVSSNTSLNN